VGDDAYGLQSLNGLQADQIDTSYIESIQQCATGVAGILVDDRGQNIIVIAPGANAQLTPQHIERAQAAISGAQLLICQCETPLNTIQAAIHLAHAHGVKVVFNPAPVIALPADLFSKIDYLVVNETEATQLSQIQVTDIASAQTASQQLLNQGVKCVLLTMGEHGVCLTQPEQASRHFPAMRVTPIDTTAAGDTFVGAFAHAIGSGMAITEAIQQAQYCAALTVTKLGAQSSIPTRAEVERFKAEHQQS
jgi:ribokinase